MEDKETITVLSQMLKDHAFNEREQEAIRNAIGLMSWTKLVDAWKDYKRKIRDRKLSDQDL